MTRVDEIPFTISFKTISTERLRVGCKRGPMTNPGFIATKSIPFSCENFQATSSAKIFEST